MGLPYKDILTRTLQEVPVLWARLAMFFHPLKVSIVKQHICFFHTFFGSNSKRYRIISCVELLRLKNLRGTKTFFFLTL